MSNAADKDIKKEAVEKLFDAAAAKHGDINSVLDATASEAAKHSNIYRDFFTREYILKHVAPKSNDVVLDFGCGVGRITAVFAPKVKKITGFDVSKGMLDIARQKNASPNSEFVHFDGGAFPFADNTYDKIFTNWVLQHSSNEDVLNYLKECKRVLKPGGKVYLFEQVMNEEVYSTSKTHVYRLADNYIQLLKSGGFESVDNFPVMRVPSRGMSLWNKKLFYNNGWKQLLGIIDNLTLLRKPQFAKYYTMAFIAAK